MVTVQHVRFTRTEPGAFAEKRLRPTYQRLPTGPLYVFLCSGEVRTVPKARAIRLGRLALDVLCTDCRHNASFPRKDVYFCSRFKMTPPILF